MTVKIVMPVQSLLALPNRVSIATIMLIITLMVFIGSDYIFGPFGEIIRDRLLIIFVSLLLGGFILNITNKKVTLPTRDASKGFAVFALGALVTFFAVTALNAVLPANILKLTEPLGATTLPAGGGILVMLLIAYSEEFIFRFILPIGMGLKALVSSVLFSIFHIFVLLTSGYAATTTELMMTLGILFALGMVWSAMANRFGLMASTGSHWIWNLKALAII